MTNHPAFAANRAAVITGAASGIGLAAAMKFAGLGMKLALADANAEALEAAHDRVSKLTGRPDDIRSFVIDVSRISDLERLRDAAYEAFGEVAVLMNNAAIGSGGGVLGDPEKWRRLIDVNLWGVIHGVEAFVPRMVAGKQPGHVVNTASMAGLIASQGLGIYNTTKYAVVGLSETLQKDLRGYDIGVSVLCPMGVNTQIRQSDRNRPAALRNEAAEGEGRAVELIGRYLPPEHVAERVLRAIYANRLYVITHEEGLTPLKRRFERMAQAIEENK